MIVLVIIILSDFEVLRKVIKVTKHRGITYPQYFKSVLHQDFFIKLNFTKCILKHYENYSSTSTEVCVQVYLQTHRKRFERVGRRCCIIISCPEQRHLIFVSISTNITKNRICVLKGILVCEYLNTWSVGLIIKNKHWELRSLLSGFISQKYYLNAKKRRTMNPVKETSGFTVKFVISWPNLMSNHTQFRHNLYPIQYFIYRCDCIELMFKFCEQA